MRSVWVNKAHIAGHPAPNLGESRMKVVHKGDTLKIAFPQACEMLVEKTCIRPTLQNKEDREAAIEEVRIDTERHKAVIANKPKLKKAA